MGSEAVLDFAPLLQPVPNGAAVGSDLRKDVSATSPYFRLKSERSQASAKERAGAGGVVNDAAEAVVLWRSITDLSLQVLQQNSKDLQVGAWLIEGLARAKGFAGLRDGFRLVRELCERYWDELHPMPDEDGIATRVAPLVGLNGDESEGTLIAPIARIPIARLGDEPFATWHWQKAVAAFQGDSSDENHATRRAQFEASNAELRRKIEQAARTAAAGFYDAMIADIDAALGEIGQLSNLLDQKCGAAAPSFGSVRSALNAWLDVIRAIARDQLATPPTVGDEASAGNGSVGAAARGDAGGSVSGELATREQAFAQLKRVADFFRRTEPHSPISYVVEHAVRLGGLSLPDMLTELIPDEGARDAFFKRTGIRPPAQTS